MSCCEDLSTPQLRGYRLWLTALAGLLLSGSGQAATGLEHTTLPARGEQQTLVHVDGFGRYAITVHSEQGTALQLLDRMAGPGQRQGVVGSSNGRIDRFLDRGDYKLLTFSHLQGEGEATLTLHPFQELNAHPAPRLIEHRLVSESLADFQQRSYWLDIQERETVVLQAAGRSLADLRLWRDGNWLVDAQPVEEVLTPRPGQPLKVLTLVTTLEPGLYMLSAYGGPAQDWAESSDEQPFYLRRGIPRLGGAGRQYYTSSPFGRDYWLVPGSANYYRLELPEAEEATLSVSRYNESDPLSAGYNRKRETIDKESIPPVTELTTRNGSENWSLVSIEREAGKPYVLQHFEDMRQYRVSDEGSYWVSTIRAGHGEDSADAGAIVVHHPRNGQSRFHWADAIELDSDSGWQRRFNLLGEVNLFLEVTESGPYRFTTEGVDARIRVEPFLLSRPRGYETPPFRDGQWVETLDEGFYVLTLRPESGNRSRGKGIVTLSMEAIPGFGAALSPSTAVTSVHLPELRVGYREGYTVYSNALDGVASGLIVRKLPIELAEPLPVVLAAGETIEVPFQLPEAGTVSVIAEDGRRITFAVDDRARASQYALDKGTYRLSLSNEGEHAEGYSLQWQPRRLAAETPLPAISPQRLAARPNFPDLRAGQDFFRDVVRDQRLTVNINVEQPALYRLESTGLLHTEGNLRTRVVTRLAHADANGVGRNFLISRYLREGDYQLTTQPQGRSRGDMGLQLVPATLNEGGSLEPNVVVRRLLPGGEGLLYHFRIPEEGEYRLRALDLRGRARIRLEDSEGWPLITPGQVNDVTRRLAPGDYRLVVLPMSVEARVITLLEPISERPPFEGHGPHAVGVDDSVSHTWYEPEADGARTPDRWLFTLPADATMNVILAEGMVAELLAVDGSSDFKGDRVYGGKAWQKWLPAGEYRLEVTSIRPDNAREYSFTLRPEELLVGMRRNLEAPGKYVVAIGDSQPFELASFGNQDVRATLLDGKGRRLAASDDREGDWNFLIASQLEPNRYHLQLEPVGRGQTTTEVSLRVPQEKAERTVELPASLTVDDNRMHYYPLQLDGDGGLLLFAASVADGSDSVGLALERQQDGLWQTVGSDTGRQALLAVPLAEDSEAGYRLRVWSASGRSLPIRVGARLLEADEEDEDELAEGLELEPVAELPFPVGVASVELEQNGSLLLGKADPLLRWGGREGVALAGNRRGHISASEGLVWLVRPLYDTASEVVVSATRLALVEGVSLPLELAPEQASSINLADIPWVGGSSQLLVASSAVGQPLLRLDGVESAGLTGIAPRQTVMLRHDNDADTLLLQGDPSLPNAIPARLQLYSFPESEELELGDGVHEMTVPATGVLQVELAERRHTLQLALPAGVAAELRLDGASVQTLWSGEEAGSFELSARADALYLYNTAVDEVRAALTIRAGTGEGDMTTRSPLVGRYDSNGVLVVKVALDGAGGGRWLRLEGAVHNVLALQSDGTVLSGPGMQLTADALLLIEHGPGALAAWLADEQGNTELDVALRMPAKLGDNRLNGASIGLTRNSGAPEGVRLSSGAALLLRLRNARGREAFTLLPAGGERSLYLPQGDNLIALYPLYGGLDGTLTLQPLAITPLSEGLGEESLLRPGDSRLYRFSLPRKTTVGLGVNASVDIVNAVLMDATGMQLGEGLVQMHELEAGDYLLRIEAPADGAAVTVRPALVGTEIPSDGAPPADVIQNYLEQAGLKAR